MWGLVALLGEFAVQWMRRARRLARARRRPPNVIVLSEVRVALDRAHERRQHYATEDE